MSSVLPLPAFAFLDLETTGTHAGGDRITEIGIVRVDVAGEDVAVREWQSLVDPGVPIPPPIQVLNELLTSRFGSRYFSVCALAPISFVALTQADNVLSELFSEFTPLRGVPYMLLE